MKFQNKRENRSHHERGATAVHLIVIMVPVLFGLIGFAVDLGMIYSVKGELRAAAESMALAAAQQLFGTDASTDAATSAALLTVDSSNGFGNRYYFNGLPIGQTNGTLESTVSNPTFYSTAADAIASGSSGAGQVSGSQARHVRVTITAETKLLFWSFLPIVSIPKVPILATAVAGMSAPLCQACGIEPFTVAAIDASDTTDFGYVIGTKYSLAYLCTGATPTILPGAAAQASYLLLNRLDTTAVNFPDEASQAFRVGAGGLPGNTNSAVACFRVNNTETIWASAVVNQCSMNQVAPVVTEALCGLDTRFESTPQAACTSIPSVDVLSTAYAPDSDVNDYDAFTDYTGNGRRIITIPIVDTLNATGDMTVLGFRQFLVVPSQGATTINPADSFGRFAAIYIGSVAPVKQGRFDGCQQAAGPGKVVLHQ
jgi:Flp pilus assembly protein TadG